MDYRGISLGIAMKSKNKVNNEASNGNSNPSMDGGFDGYLVGNIVSTYSNYYSEHTYFWTSSSSQGYEDGLLAWQRTLVNTRNGVYRRYYSRDTLFSVRCIIDN